jgi:5-methylcytosine-specific restriction protein A
MALSDLTPASVEAAIAEFDAVGRDIFLERYGFGAARRYFLSVNGKLYDSKAIVGAAHGYISPTHMPLQKDEFSGGENSVAGVLRQLGFDIVIQVENGKNAREVPLRNPHWIRDELILALELYLSDRASPPSKNSEAVANLSHLLNQLNAAVGREGNGVFRNANGVYMKMMNFRRFDPEVTAAGKVGLSRGNKDEEFVWNEFAKDLPRLFQTAQSIRQLIGSEQSRLNPLAEFDFEEAEEGRLLTVTHLRRERNRNLVEARKNLALKETGQLRCECCNLNFVERYGKHGEGFIEVHHTQPLHTLTEGQKTHVKDLALLCSNCHRMIHRKRPWLSVEDVRALVAKTDR